MKLNKVCEFEDFSRPEIVRGIHEMEPDLKVAYAGYPAKWEHRKSWEYAQLLLGLDQLGVLRPDAWALSVAAGWERAVYYLTNRVRWVFATDIYGSGDFSGREAQAAMLFDPGRFAQQPWNRRHLVVQHMNALELQHDDDTFDFAFSLSSIEHFGGVEGAVRSLQEMARVVKPGGVVAVTTEVILNGKPAYQEPELHLFSPQEIEALSSGVTSLQLVEPVILTTDLTRQPPPVSLERAAIDAAHGRATYPQSALEHKGRVFTSVSLFWRKAAV